MPELERIPEEHIYRAYGIYLLSSQHRLIRRLKRVYEPSIHGNKAWRASFLLMDYLLHNPPRRGVPVVALCLTTPGSGSSATMPLSAQATAGAGSSTRMDV